MLFFFNAADQLKDIIAWYLTNYEVGVGVGVGDCYLEDCYAPPNTTQLLTWSKLNSFKLTNSSLVLKLCFCPHRPPFATIVSPHHWRVVANESDNLVNYSPCEKGWDKNCVPSNNANSLLSSSSLLLLFLFHMYLLQILINIKI